MIKKLGLTTIILNVALLSGCGGGTSTSSNNSTSSKSADIIINNASTHDAKSFWIKKTSDKNYDNDVLTEVLKTGGEVLISTNMCDIHVDARAKSTDGLYSTIVENTLIPCGETIHWIIRDGTSKNFSRDYGNTMQFISIP